MEIIDDQYQKMLMYQERGEWEEEVELFYMLMRERTQIPSYECLLEWCDEDLERVVQVYKHG